MVGKNSSGMSVPQGMATAVPVRTSSQRGIDTTLNLVRHLASRNDDLVMGKRREGEQQEGFRSVSQLSVQQEACCSSSSSSMSFPVCSMGHFYTLYPPK